VSTGATQVYVYYRVRPADAAALTAAVHALHAQLRSSWPGLVCALARRAEDDADTVTMMETYSHAEGPAPQCWDEIEHLARQRLAGWIVGPRHVEAFVACA